MIYDLKIRDVRTPDGVSVNIYVENGKIAAVSSLDYPSVSIIDGNGLLALPGAVDTHVHMRDLKLSYKEDFTSGTAAALAGGVTFVADMPNTIPPTDCLANLKLKLEVAKRRSLVDFSLFVRPPKRLKELREMLRSACGIKVYLYEYGPEDNDFLREAMAVTASMNKAIYVHAEEGSLIKGGARDLKEHNRARPMRAELEGIRRVARIAPPGVTPHITHATCGRALALAKSLGFTVDVAVPHLVFTSASKLGTRVKVNPPLRSPVARTLLLRSIERADCLVSDHAPHALNEKARPFEEAPSGVPSLDVFLSVLHTVFTREVLSVRELFKLVTYRAAREVGAKFKGRIAPRYDADIVLFDPKEEWTVKAEDLKSKAAEVSPFIGARLVGRVKKVFVRGVLAYDEGEILVKPGFGKFVECEKLI